MNILIVRPATMVEKGNIIGYVGSTGLATGPHLHFEMYKDGAFVNPLTAKIAIEPSVPKKEDPLFAAKKKRALEQLSSMTIEDRPIVLSVAVPEKFTSRDMAQKDKDKRLALATSNSSSTVSDSTSSSQPSAKKKNSFSKSSSRSKRSHSRSTSVKKSKSSRTHRSARR